MYVLRHSECRDDLKKLTTASAYYLGEVFCFFDPISFGNENYVDLGGIFFFGQGAYLYKG